ncbi:helix-turn-helix domain-containing protein [Actinomadura barringtoniae]|uniref:Helix-turn-helix domain-containing protein n=1 Tax=Actinomadura barringtoniae TaxID=1427535 RepID=A0A939PGE5_9ACTN|nr:helix-turn-helix transcriptional regulator [Actinomadura barringtoniae]MBO2451798.1 helix-turn-helix domain-containing protein [Actinomadura barringtoniae]
MGSSAQNMLGRFLREWRGRVTLEDAGLPGRRGNRNSTLTQEDLARLSGYSVRTISALEQGSEHRPTPGLLTAIAQALRLSEEERRALWQLTGNARPPETDFAADGDPSLTRIIDLLEPNPAYLCDAAYNVQYHNRAFANWVFDFGSVPPDQRNLAKWLFRDDHAEHIVVDGKGHWEALVARMRGVLAGQPHDREFAGLVEELCDTSPRFKELWDRDARVASYRPGGEILTLREPGHTDPGQADDLEHHVAVTQSNLSPMTPNDERRFSTFLLPEGYTAPPYGPCAACARS